VFDQSALGQHGTERERQDHRYFLPQSRTLLGRRAAEDDQRPRQKAAVLSVAECPQFDAREQAERASKHVLVSAPQRRRPTSGVNGEKLPRARWQSCLKHLPDLKHLSEIQEPVPPALHGVRH
jgi:hypothetical protein